MTRTITRAESTLNVKLPPGSVSFNFPTDTAEVSKGYVYATFPRGSGLDTSLHWHESYTEYMKVLRGRALVSLDGVEKVYTAEDDEVVIHPYVWHIVRRADRGKVEGGDDEELVIHERTDPADGEKEIFFRNGLSMILDAKAELERLSFRFILEGMALMAQTDLYPVLVPWGPRWFSRYTTYTVL